MCYWVISCQADTTRTLTHTSVVCLIVLGAINVESAGGEMPASAESVGDYITQVRSKVLSLWESVRAWEKGQLVVESGWREDIRDCVVVFYTKERRVNAVRRSVQKTYKIVRKDEGQALKEIAEKVITKLKAAQESLNAEDYAGEAGEIGGELAKVIEYTETGFKTHGRGLTTLDEEGAIVDLERKLQEAETERNTYQTLYEGEKAARVELERELEEAGEREERAARVWVEHKSRNAWSTTQRTAIGQIHESLADLKELTFS